MKKIECKNDRITISIDPNTDYKIRLEITDFETTYFYLDLKDLDLLEYTIKKYKRKNWWKLEHKDTEK